MVNTKFHTSIAQEMVMLERMRGRATIGDAIAAFRRRGNGDYLRTDPDMYEADEIQTPLDGGGDVQAVHDMGHLCTRLGLLPQNEQWTIPFDLGLTKGWAWANGDITPEGVQEKIKKWSDIYRVIDKKFF